MTVVPVILGLTVVQNAMATASVNRVFAFVTAVGGGLNVKQ